jgi:hypothetical protein
VAEAYRTYRRVRQEFDLERQASRISDPLSDTLSHQISDPSSDTLSHQISDPSTISVDAAMVKLKETLRIYTRFVEAAFDQELSRKYLENLGEDCWMPGDSMLPTANISEGEGLIWAFLNIFAGQ